MPLIDNFTSNLREAMLHAGLTGLQLAERSGVHFVTISRILNHKLNPSIEVCEKLAEAAGIRADTIFLEPVKKTAKSA